MARIPFPDYNTQSYYVRSYAALPPAARCQYFSSSKTYSYTQNGTNGTGDTCTKAIADWNRNVLLKNKGPPPPDKSGTDAITQGLQGAGKAITGAGAALGGGAAAAGKTVTDSALGSSNAVQQGLTGAGKTITDSVLGESNDIQNRFKGGVTTIYDSIMGESNAIQQSIAQMLGPYAQYLPFIAIGGAAILLIVLLKR